MGELDRAFGEIFLFLGLNIGKRSEREARLVELDDSCVVPVVDNAVDIDIVKLDYRADLNSFLERNADGGCPIGILFIACVDGKNIAVCRDNNVGLYTVRSAGCGVNCGDNEVFVEYCKVEPVHVLGGTCITRGVFADSHGILDIVDNAEVIVVLVAEIGERESTFGELFLLFGLNGFRVAVRNLYFKARGSAFVARKVDTAYIGDLEGEIAADGCGRACEFEGEACRHGAVDLTGSFVAAEGDVIFAGGFVESAEAFPVFDTAYNGVEISFLTRLCDGGNECGIIGEPEFKRLDAAFLESDVRDIENDFEFLAGFVLCGGIGSAQCKERACGLAAFGAAPSAIVDTACECGDTGEYDHGKSQKECE